MSTETHQQSAERDWVQIPFEEVPQVLQDIRRKFPAIADDPLPMLEELAACNKRMLEARESILRDALEQGAQG